MNMNLSEVIFILDRSGSMSGLEAATISGYNSFLQSQRETSRDVQVSTVLFDNQYEMLHDGINIRMVRPITDNEYFTRGSTAMLDAIGKTILDVGRRLSQTPEEERPAKIIFVITTDGMENSSHEFSYPMIRDMIQHQKEKYNWEFIFLGANIDAEGTAEVLGISRNRSAKYRADVDGTNDMFCCMSDVVEDLKNNECLSLEWKDQLAEKKVQKGKKR